MTVTSTDTSTDTADSLKLCSIIASLLLELYAGGLGTAQKMLLKVFASTPERLTTKESELIAIACKAIQSKGEELACPPTKCTCIHLIAHIIAHNYTDKINNIERTLLDYITVYGYNKSPNEFLDLVLEILECQKAETTQPKTAVEVAEESSTATPEPTIDPETVEAVQETAPDHAQETEPEDEADEAKPVAEDEADEDEDSAVDAVTEVTVEYKVADSEDTNEVAVEDTNAAQVTAPAPETPAADTAQIHSDATDAKVSTGTESTVDTASPISAPASEQEATTVAPVSVPAAQVESITSAPAPALSQEQSAPVAIQPQQVQPLQLPQLDLSSCGAKEKALWLAVYQDLGTALPAEIMPMQRQKLLLTKGKAELYLARFLDILSESERQLLELVQERGLLDTDSISNLRLVLAQRQGIINKHSHSCQLPAVLRPRLERSSLSCLASVRHGTDYVGWEIGTTGCRS